MSSRDAILISMTAGMSLQKWHDLGLIDRELGYLGELSRLSGPLVFLSYGEDIDRENEILQQRIPSARVVWARGRRRLPFDDVLVGLRTKPASLDLSNCKIARTNQFLGSWFVERLANQWKMPWILRCGYIHSWNYREGGIGGVIKGGIYRSLERRAVQRASRIVITQNAARDYFARVYGRDPGSMVLIGNPIDTELFSPREENIQRDVVCVARLSPEKNLGALIDACALEGMSLTIVGSGPMEGELREIAARRAADVVFAGRVNNGQLPDILASHRVFALVSQYEGNPKALLEAMAMALPCVATNIEGHRPLIGQSERGKLVEHEADAIGFGLRQMVTDQSLANRLGRAAREFVVSHHCLAAAARMESDLIDDVLRVGQG